MLIHYTKAVIVIKEVSTIIYKDIIGTTRQSRAFGEYTVLSREGSDRRKQSLMLVRFTNTGYRTIVPLARVLNGSVKDYYMPVVSGVGYLGDSTKVQRLMYYRLWTDMLRRCYNKEYKEYIRYGQKGVLVDTAWHNFEVFANSIPKLAGYNEELYLQGKIYLDKDKLSNDNRVYSECTCCFLTGVEQQRYLTGAVAPIKFKAISPDGVEIIATGIRPFARDNELEASCIQGCLSGKRKKHKGWSFSIM